MWNIVDSLKTEFCQYSFLQSCRKTLLGSLFIFYILQARTLLYRERELLNGFEQGTGNMRFYFGKVTQTPMCRKDQRELRLEASVGVVGASPLKPRRGRDSGSLPPLLYISCTAEYSTISGSRPEATNRTGLTNPSINVKVNKSKEFLSWEK